MKFKVGQVVAWNPKFSSNKEYSYISGFGKTEDGEDLLFMNGDIATKHTSGKYIGKYINAYHFPEWYRKLTDREAGRQ